MELNDATGLGKAVGKLVHEVSHLIQYFDEPRHIVRTAEARATEKRLLADAEVYVRHVMQQPNSVQSNLLSASDMPSLERLTTGEIAETKVDPIIEQMVSNAVRNFLREELNKQQVFHAAAETLESTPPDTVSDIPVEPDWLSRLFDIARNVSDTQMQELFGKILAGEIVHPGSYSLRTLDTLRNLSKEEAEALLYISKWVILQSSTCFIDHQIVQAVETEDDYAKFSNYTIFLEEASILQLGLNVQLRGTGTFVYPGYVLNLTSKEIMSFEAIRFTRVGTELLNLVTPQQSRKYLFEFARKLQKFGTLELATLKQIHPDGFIEHNNDVITLTDDEITRLETEDEIVGYFEANHKLHQVPVAATLAEIAKQVGGDHARVAQILEGLVTREILTAVDQYSYTLSKKYVAWRLAKVSFDDLSPDEPDYLRKAVVTSVQQIRERASNLAIGKPINYSFEGNNVVRFAVTIENDNNIREIVVDAGEVLKTLPHEAFINWLVEAVCQIDIHLKSPID